MDGWVLAQMASRFILAWEGFVESRNDWIEEKDTCTYSAFAYYRGDPWEIEYIRNT